MKPKEGATAAGTTVASIPGNGARSPDNASVRTGATDTTRCAPPLADKEVQEQWKVAASSSRFIESRHCLAEHFRRSRQPAEERRALSELINHRAGRYDPTALLAMAVLELNARQADLAVKHITDAERFQSNLVGTDLYSQLVLIQEVKGNAYQLRFNASRSPVDLDRAVSSWRQYLSLARDRSDAAGEARAETRLRSLELLKRHEAEEGNKP